LGFSREHPAKKRTAIASVIMVFIGDSPNEICRKDYNPNHVPVFAV
jgi:hypothetical protein